jgi:hypothetical protein
VTNLEDCVLFFRAQPKVAIVQEKFRTVLFQRNRKVVCVLKNFSVIDVDLKSSRRAAVFADTAGDRQGRLLSQRFERFPNFRRDRVLRHDALHNPGPVAQLRKQKFSAGAHVVEPALEDYFFANVFR